MADRWTIIGAAHQAWCEATTGYQRAARRRRRAEEALARALNAEREAWDAAEKARLAWSAALDLPPRKVRGVR